MSGNVVFSLSRDEESLSCVGPDGLERRARLPWRIDHRFGFAWLIWQQLCSRSDLTDTERTELFDHARTLGETLFATLFDENDKEFIDDLIGSGHAWRPVVTIRTDDDLLLSLPWELLYHDGSWLVRDQRIDVIRTTVGEVAGSTFLRQPTVPFKLVVNVSAPEGTALSYETESYRITMALAGRCEIVPTELGTVEDLLETIEREAPRGVHFSGHGGPGTLVFEDEEGRQAPVFVSDLLDKLRNRIPDELNRPAFFYLASCHGNSLANAEKGNAGSTSSAAQLHRAGVTQVVGYFGPILDELSTLVEEVLYQMIAEGHDTRHAVRQARAALSAAPIAPGEQQRRARTATVATEVTAPAGENDPAPFAWAQLVFYHRGPEFPLSTAGTATRLLSRDPRRTFEAFGNRRVLRTGFIGRRSTLHGVRRRIRQGERVLVFQGLGGLGKSTLASQALPMVAPEGTPICTLWCQEVEGEDDRAAKLVAQFLEFCGGQFGFDWQEDVQTVDRMAQDPAQRFLMFLQVAVRKLPRMALLLRQSRIGARRSQG